MSELRIPLSDKLKSKLEEFRSHLGPKGATLSYAELLEEMADVGVAALKVKRFGKKRVSEQTNGQTTTSSHQQDVLEVVPEKETEFPAPVVKKGTDTRYVTRADKHAVWQRD